MSTEATETAPDIESKARRMGWRPQDEFRGAKDKWVDATTFVERGQEMLPLLQASNRGLQADLRAAREETERVRQEQQTMKEQINSLTQYNTEQALNTVKASRDRIRNELIQAKKDEDVDAEVRLTEQLSEHNDALRDAEKAAKDSKKPAVETPVEKKPVETSVERDMTELNEWMAENPWFDQKSPDFDQRKARRALFIAEEMRGNPELKDLKGRAFFEAVAEELDATMGTASAKSTTKVASGEHTPSTSSGRGKHSYSNLPADAKAACDKFEKSLVGEGLAFKTQKEWREKYVADYAWD